MAFSTKDEQEILDMIKKQDEFKQNMKLVNVLAVEQSLRKAAFKHNNLSVMEEKLKELTSFRKYLQNDTNLALVYDEYYANRERIFLKIVKSLGRSTIEANQYKWHKLYKLDLEDCKSMIYSAILHAIDNFTLTRPTNCKFASYMWLCISQHFQRFFIKNHAQRRDSNDQHVSLESNTLVDETDQEESSLSNIIPDKQDVEADLSYQILLEKVYSELTSEKERLLLEYMLNGENRKDISVKLNMTPEKTNDELRRLKSKVRKLLKKQI